MPLKKLSDIEEKLNKDYLDIKNRYVRLKRCKYILLILKTVLIQFINQFIIYQSSNNNSFKCSTYST